MKFLVLVLLVAAMVLHFIKDENGVSYLETGYKMVKYYVVDRNTDALDKAKDVQEKMQKRQDALQQVLDSE